MPKKYILLIEPYFTGSHKVFANGLKKYSRHRIEILKLSGNFWKWRMHGGAVTLARMFNEFKKIPDIIVATDMLDLTTFLALTRTRTHNIPIFIYFHENQLTYPWSPTDRDVENKRDVHYGFINYTSALAADKVFFNSSFHLNSFLDSAKKFLKNFPDNNEIESISDISKKSYVLNLGLELKRFDRYKKNSGKLVNKRPLILWNHRWEYDKNPEMFFKAMYKLKEKGISFDLAILGENFQKSPDIFAEAKIKLKSNIVQFGYCKTFSDYAMWLYLADILPITSTHDFFGISVVEAIYCGCYPVLPMRNAYKEHIPVRFKDNYYDTYEEFIELLFKTVKDIDEVRNISFSRFVERYDWKDMIKKYDTEFDLINI